VNQNLELIVNTINFVRPMEKKNKVPRRGFIARMAAGISGLALIPIAGVTRQLGRQESNETMEQDTIIGVKPLGFQWETEDPFLFCVHHEDHFPKGNDQMGPAASLEGRSIGDDFIIKDGWRMYHGDTVPGFPGHPHRGFETVTVVRKGLVDHADSLGAAGRYGNGDVQWMTAGKGVQHSEMFPLLSKEQENPLELFQIWLNLPKRNKMVEPHFKMLWSEKIPRVRQLEKEVETVHAEVIAGKLGTEAAPAPPPNSWAADPANEVSILNIRIEAGATFTLPAASEGINRTLYFYRGKGLKIAGKDIPFYHAARVLSQRVLEIQAGTEACSVLVLQGRPINEPVIQYGPFVMNTREEIKQAFDDYHATRFGGWPWPKYGQVHGRDKGRFAKHADGKLEEMG
jgi:quercetin 2,3-dioxygenase